jgi:formylglycine-generating enzyme required for sulfatase activity
MVSIPEGAFIMGSSATDANARLDEQPKRKVQIDAFWMSDSEITWALYKLYLNRTDQDINQKGGPRGNTVSLNPDAISGATIPYVDMSLGMGTDPNYPVVNVTRRAASQFCKWLSAKTGHFYRLPTEAEWEYASRAGRTTPYFFESATGQLTDYAWFAENSTDRYHGVKLKLPNPWGLYDILGNVAEWTLDSYNPEGYNAENVEFVPATKEYPGVLRGGHFKSKALDLRSASRLSSSPIWKQRDPQFPRSKWWFTDAPFAGFRIVRPVQAPSPELFELYWNTP